jgi:hypothetical protein
MPLQPTAGMGQTHGRPHPYVIDTVTDCDYFSNVTMRVPRKPSPRRCTK